MPQEKNLVSIVIPAYNADAFISDTLRSVVQQSYPDWELWLINDGSTDNTESEARKIADDRINIFNQKNAGVSSARNQGLAAARGKYIVFFDADDLMSPEFLEVRVNELDKDESIGFVGGMVETFPKKSPYRKAVAEDPEKEIHFFDASVVTIPSNYVFRKDVIRNNNILFNESLSSSADRFFLLEVAKHAKGKALSLEDGRLLYRITETSMSHNVTPKLAEDYYKFYQELNAKGLMPRDRRKTIQSRYLFSLASSFSLVGNWRSAAGLMCRSFAAHPINFLNLAAKRIFRSR